jgi:hypothetical protein
LHGSRNHWRSGDLSTLQNMRRGRFFPPTRSRDGLHYASLRELGVA